MRKITCLILISLLTTLTFAQNVDESGVIINLNSRTLTENSNTILKSAKAKSADIIHSIPSPTSSNLDIAFDGSNLWLASPSDDSIYKISPIDGTLLKSLPCGPDPYGLTFDGNALWVTDRSSKLLKQIDTLDGSILQQFEINNEFAAGLAWDNHNLWHANNQGGGIALDSIYYMSSITGEVINSYLPFGTQPTGLAFDGTYLWQSDNDDDVIYKIEISNFTVIDTIQAPGGQYPNGLTFDGQYLWVSNNDADSLYQIDIGFIPISISDASPSSSHINVYPNPSSGSFTFTNDLNVNSRKYFVKIYNQNGQIVRHIAFDKNSSIMINLDDLSSNIYFYTVSDKYEIIESGKLIKE